MTTTLLRLDHLAVLRVSGPDRVALLQGQTSNDARRVDASRSQLTSFNNPKGRCYAIAVLAAWDDTHLLITERSVAEALAKRLRMYVLRSKAAVEAADELAVLGRLGDVDNAATGGVPVLGADPSGFASALTDGVLSIHLPDGRGLSLMPRAQAAALADGGDAWRARDVAVGLPTVVAETAEHFVPLWLGLERWGAIDYKKGCYTGQEIVARTHYLGVVKQRLYRGRVALPVAPGAKVMAGTQAIGEVVIGAHDGAGVALLLASREPPADAALSVDGQALSGLRGFD